MNAPNYKNMFDLETSYWWYRGLHRILSQTLRDLGLGQDHTIIDAGCGTGGLLDRINRDIGAQTIGFDFSADAVGYCRQRAPDSVCRASINSIPFADGCADAVLCIDVLETEPVEVQKAYCELNRIVRPGGYLVIVVPAYDFLFDEQHHEAVNAVRRFNRKMVRDLVKTQPAKILRMTNLFPIFLPAFTVWRLRGRFFPTHTGDQSISDVRPLPWAVNQFLFLLVEAERLMLRWFDFPFGSTIMVVLQRPETE